MGSGLSFTNAHSVWLQINSHRSTWSSQTIRVTVISEHALKLSLSGMQESLTVFSITCQLVPLSSNVSSIGYWYVKRSTTSW